MPINLDVRLQQGRTYCWTPPTGDCTCLWWQLSSFDYKIANFDLFFNILFYFGKLWINISSIPLQRQVSPNLEWRPSLVIFKLFRKLDFRYSSKSKNHRTPTPSGHHLGLCVLTSTLLPSLSVVYNSEGCLSTSLTLSKAIPRYPDTALNDPTVLSVDFSFTSANCGISLRRNKNSSWKS